MTIYWSPLIKDHHHYSVLCTGRFLQVFPFTEYSCEPVVDEIACDHVSILYFNATEPLVLDVSLKGDSHQQLIEAFVNDILSADDSIARLSEFCEDASPTFVHVLCQVSNHPSEHNKYSELQKEKV